MNIFSEYLYRLLGFIGGTVYANRQFEVKILIKHFFLQKIFRINGKVPWLVHPSTVVKAPHKIKWGTRNPGLSPWCYLDGRNGIEFGENVWVGPRVSIISMNHDLNDYTKYQDSPPIRIGSNCWIAAGAIITAGVKLGDHTVVAAGSVVTKSFEGNMVIAGIPAKKIRTLEPYNSEQNTEFE